MADNEIYNSITSEACSVGFKNEQLIKYNVIKHPLFDIDKYLKILKLKPTIFANLCWGGYTYNTMGLKFNTPLINMFESEEDYIKFLKNPKFYINQEIELQKWTVGDQFKIYPVVKCADILFYFNHYHDRNFSNIKNIWDERKKRINWDNLIIMMYTANPDTEEQFNKLPYKKKFCFVPYETDKKSSLYIDINVKGKTFAWIINRIGDGTFLYYDPFDLLLTGIPKKLITDNRTVINNYI